MNAVGADQQVAAHRDDVDGAAALEAGGHSGPVVLEAGEMVAGVHLVATDPLDHRLVQDRLQFAAVDRELREFVATVEAAQVAPDLLAEAVGVDQLVGRSEEHTSELQSLMRISYA